MFLSYISRGSLLAYSVWIGLAMGLSMTWLGCASSLTMSDDKVLSTPTVNLVQVYSPVSASTAVPTLPPVYLPVSTSTSVPTLTPVHTPVSVSTTVPTLTPVYSPVLTSTAVPTLTPAHTPVSLSTAVSTLTPVPLEVKDNPASEQTYDDSRETGDQSENNQEQNVKAPEIKDIETWINTKQITANDLKGEVYLVDFWTYTCVNCVRTLPYLRSWYQKYSDLGLIILGIHTPEFDFEKSIDNVTHAVIASGIAYPVALDNNRTTWKAFKNRFWPAKYLVDKNGYVRYTHFGEGNYSQTEQWIRKLLMEAGKDVDQVYIGGFKDSVFDPKAITADPSTSLTREIYTGYGRNIEALVTRSIPPYVVQEEYYSQQEVELEYKDIWNGNYQNHFVYLQGLWLNKPESLVHARETNDYEDYIALKFYATSVNAVMGNLADNEFNVKLTIDGQPLAQNQAGLDVWFDEKGESFVTVNRFDIYNLVNLTEIASHEFMLSSNSLNFAIYSFTFGAYLDGEPAW